MSNLFYKKDIKRKRGAIVICILCLFCLVMFLLGKNMVNNVKNGDLNFSNKSTEDSLPTWDLSDLYNGINDEQITKDLNTLEKRIKKFAKEYTNQVDNLSGYQLYKAMLEFEGINELASKIMSFAYLKYAENLSIE